MKQATRLLPLLPLLALLASCGSTATKLYCPPISEFPAAVQDGAAAELAAPPAKPNLTRMLDAMAADRARHRASCP